MVKYKAVLSLIRLNDLKGRNLRDDDDSEMAERHGFYSVEHRLDLYEG